MLNLDQIQSELRAIEDFDAVFVAANRRYPEEVVGFAFRQLRKQELVRLAESMVSRDRSRSS